MSNAMNQLEKFVVSIVESEQSNRYADALAEIKAFHVDLPSYVLAAISVRVRRDGREFPHGRILNQAEVELVVEAVRGFLSRHALAEPQEAV